MGLYLGIRAFRAVGRKGRGNRVARTHHRLALSQGENRDRRRSWEPGKEEEGRGWTWRYWISGRWCCRIWEISPFRPLLDWGSKRKKQRRTSRGWCGTPPRTISGRPLCAIGLPRDGRTKDRRRGARVPDTTNDSRIPESLNGHFLTTGITATSFILSTISNILERGTGTRSRNPPALLPLPPFPSRLGKQVGGSALEVSRLQILPSTNPRNRPLSKDIRCRCRPSRHVIGRTRIRRSIGELWILTTS